eukprot:PLAT12203.1.p2 GENE.PLAT12203.1~~PLAT12203.1.p2  ORF type:complete len:355 (-),score=136.63 PLAT12203.1:78-1142(-)
MLSAARCLPRASAPLAAAAPLLAPRWLSSSSKEPVRVAVTGAAGQIGYALNFRIASGEMLGKDQPVILSLVELPHAMDALEGVAMELADCAFPLLAGIEMHSDLDAGFADIDYALLVGAKPRGPGMERGDLLKDNGEIFISQGAALNGAKKTAKVLLVGNPANTNCLIAASHASSLPKENFAAMTRLDHDRALAQLQGKTGCAVTDVEKFCIWGNHSPTMYPDLSHALIDGKAAKEVIGDDAWIDATFIPDVQQRGAAIIKARGSSSAASAANAAIATMRDWALGSDGEWVSMAVPSDGSYGIAEGIYFSYPVITKDGGYEIVQGLPIDEYSQAKLDATEAELREERSFVEEML